MASRQAKEILSRFTALFDSQKSMAPCHQLLSEHQLVHESYGTFRKRWKGASPWVRSHIRADHLEQLLSIVGVQDEYVSTAVSELKRLWMEYKRPMPFHGSPLFSTSHYRD